MGTARANERYGAGSDFSALKRPFTTRPASGPRLTRAFRTLVRRAAMMLMQFMLRFNELTNRPRAQAPVRIAWSAAA